MSDEANPPLHRENVALAHSVERLYEAVESVWARWREEFLKTADPRHSDPDAYAKPLITLAEMLRMQGLRDLSGRVYERGLQLVDEHGRNSGHRLHRGALYANLAISHLEAGRYDLGISWLRAAAQEDVDNRGAPTLFDSYALRDADGILRQFLDNRVLPKLPGDLVAFLDAQLGKAHRPAELRELYRWLAGEGDIHLVGSVLDYESVRGLADAHSDSVRLICLRDLATLFEVLWKRIGTRHNDPAVRTAFSSPPTLAGLICHMHFRDRLGDRRRNPALNAHRKEGLLWNAVLKSDDLLDAIDAGIDYCAGTAHSLDNVWGYLHRPPGTFSANGSADAVARRYLFTYKIRNFTSHAFEPQDAGVRAHHEEMRTWLLQAVFHLYHWSRATGQH